MWFTNDCTDMLGRAVGLTGSPRRIVSLVPSQTEFLYAIGAGNRIVGQTVFCIHPADRFASAHKVGGTKKVRLDAIDAVQPDLIICNKEENSPELVSMLEKKYPVWVSDVRNTEDAFQMMRALGRILEAEKETEEMLEAISLSMAGRKIYHRHSCVYLIWRKPYMAAGRDTFISHMLEKGGFINMITENRYPEISEDALLAMAPPLVLLSSEPYPFAEKHIQELQNLLPSSRIMLADGEMFSWYGSRLLNSQPYFNELQRQLHKLKK